ncbi:putative F-box/FBD/LRR-repeat protein At4g13965 [Lactuca sativa]|uniref:F-box domain-containing protein n=1 Tax=Lactuca sativa TaxID=4236 RepID=A0A9R1XK63_LACSA|nr:putative F-box/FBD/LRR-repeat protein At4g13965 [Lactuca sativa]XP_052625175.1 putative F-box/FBD/LRR-repeat protein At4g13965 [Lactuca sativa]KAJ0215814.1 hypothetical protein LSAT_V11C300111500 [Lactuca sativa]
MEFDHDHVRRRVVEEDRLSSLPDELIHKILSCFDMKYAVQTCSLSSRWEFLWTSMPCFNLSSREFSCLPKFAKFVNHVLTHRNHQVEVSSVKLHFSGAASQVFVRKIASYMFSHNVQQLTVVCFPKKHHEFPPSLFSSQTLKHFTLSNRPLYTSPCLTPKTPWDFPALATLHLSHITLCEDHSQKSVDLFSKCVNLKNLTLEWFTVEAIDIITPRLSNLVLIKGRRSLVINLVAPQLEHLTIIDCSIDYLNAPPGLSSLCYTGDLPQQFSKDGFHSLNKVSICCDMYRPYKEKVACKAIKMLQELHSARYLTLNVDFIECLSSYPNLLSHHPSPFSNLICLTIDSSMRNDAYNVKMSTEARNFFLENSPNATFIMELPEPPPTKAMKQKEARAKKAKRAAEIAIHMTEFQALLDHENMNVERTQAKEKANVALEKLMAQSKAQVGKMHNQTERLMAEFKICVEEVRDLVNEEEAEVKAIISKGTLIRSLLEDMPKRERTEVEARYSRQLEEIEAQHVRLASRLVTLEGILACEQLMSHCISAYLASSNSSTTTIPTTSTSSINPMP